MSLKRKEAKWNDDDKNAIAIMGKVIPITIASAGEKIKGSPNLGKMMRRMCRGANIRDVQERVKGKKRMDTFK